MAIIKKFFKYLTDSNYRWIVNSNLGFYNKMKDEDYLKKKYKICVGRELNLVDPRFYTEKLQWLKIHNRNAAYVGMVDKYEAKSFAESVIGKKYVVPCYGVYNSFSEINFDNLPNQFVLKATHDGGAIVCRNKKEFDFKSAKKELGKRLKKNYFFQSREWPYKNIKPRIIVEQYLEDTANDALTDYKFFCFNGEPKIMYISKDRGKKPMTDFFDMGFNKLDLRIKDPNSPYPPEKPKHFDLMVDLAKKLSKGIPHVRVDFYYIDNNVYFGEMTFFHNGGFCVIKPEEWDLKMGKWIDLSKIDGNI